MGQQNNQQPERNSLVAALIGIVAGAVGAATAIFLSNKENRRKLREETEDLKERSVQVLDELGKETERMKRETGKSFQRVQQSGQKKAKT